MAGVRDADTFADLGIALADAKQYACAASAFAESLKMKPDSANVLFMFGTSLYFSGDAQEAVAPLQASEAMDARNLKLHLILAAVFDQLHQEDDAKAEWKAAVETDPLATDALDGLSQLRPAVAPAAGEHIPGEALTVGPDERHPLSFSGGQGRGPVAQPEGEILLAVEETVEGEHPGGGGVSVGEAQRQQHLGADRRGGQ